MSAYSDLVHRLRTSAINSGGLDGCWSDSELFGEAADAIERLSTLPSPPPAMEEVTEALESLVAKIDELTPAINGAIQMAAIHGSPWPAAMNWVEEMKVARSALLVARKAKGVAMASHFDQMMNDYISKTSEQERLRGYRLGLAAAASKARSWADQCAGGSGEGGEGYRNLAASIEAIDPSKGY